MASRSRGLVSTHSRPKAAGCHKRRRLDTKRVSTHSRPKAAGCFWFCWFLCFAGFNTQPPEGGWQARYRLGRDVSPVSTHSRPKAAGQTKHKRRLSSCKFQHTAARRRLGDNQTKSLLICCFNTQPPEGGWDGLNTHSTRRKNGFNTQPPEGGWICFKSFAKSFLCFNTQPPEGGWAPSSPLSPRSPLFQHTAARRRLDRANRATCKTYCFNTQPPEGG